MFEKILLIAALFVVAIILAVLWSCVEAGYKDEKGSFGTLTTTAVVAICCAFLATAWWPAAFVATIAALMWVATMIGRVVAEVAK